MKRSSKLPVYRHYRTLFESGSFCGLADGELLARFLTRDGESAELAFAVLVERHGSAVLRICRAITGHASDAEDAFQATFLVLATKASGLTIRETLGPWLACVARRISRRAQARSLARAARDVRAARLAGTRTTEIADDDDLASVLHEEIDRLPERYRLPLLLCDLESQSHQEAARTLGWPLGTVKSRQARAREQLRTRLARRGLSGALPFAGLSRSGASLVPDSLIRATAKAAVSSVSHSPVAQAVSASVSTLVTITLRTMIMTRLSVLLGVVLTVGAGVAATAWAQTFNDHHKAAANLAAANADDRASAPGGAAVFEYEIRIWKDGAPVTPTMKMRAHPGETSQLEIPEGTVGLSFRPQRLSIELTAGIQPISHTAAAALLAHAKGAGAGKADDAAIHLQELAAMTHKLHDDVKNTPTAAQLHEALRLTHDRTGAESKDHESRLAEIERKLERILSVLDRVPQKDASRNTSPAPK